MGTLKLATSVEGEPRTRKQALSCADKDHWKKAMDEEIVSLLSNDTWEIVPAPKDKNTITCQWGFKLKRNTNGGVDRYKARVVARGFSQKYGTDYDEVFAPVIRQTTFRTLLTITGQEKIIVKHYDAKTAFLTGSLKETIFMKQPEGYAIPGKKNIVCKLNKSIYGLKQAAKVWNDQLDEILKNYHFQKGEADPCLYIKHNKEGIIFLVVYVDDFLLAGRDIKKMSR